MFSDNEFTDLNSEDSFTDVSNHDDNSDQSQKYQYKITLSELLTFKLNSSENDALRWYANNEFFDKGEGGLVQVKKDYIDRGFELFGKKKLGISNEQISDDPEFVKNILIGLLGSEEEANIFINAHSQGPSALIPYIVGLSVPIGSDFQIKQPPNPKIDTTIINGETYLDFSADGFPIFDLNSGEKIGELTGPVTARFKRKQKNDTWGYELETIETNNSDIIAALKGKIFSTDEISKNYCNNTTTITNESLSNIREEHKRKTPAEVAAMSIARLFDAGYTLQQNVKSAALTKTQSLSNGIVYYTFKNNKTNDVIHAFYPTCDSDNSYPDTISLKHALNIFKKNLSISGQKQKLTVPLATSLRYRKHWLELFIEIDEKGNASAKLTDSQYMGFYYPTYYIEQAVKEVFNTKLQTEYLTQQSLLNFTDCGDFFIENSNYSLNLIDKRVRSINDDILRKHKENINNYRSAISKESETKDKTVFLSSSTLDIDSFQELNKSNLDDTSFVLVEDDDKPILKQNDLYDNNLEDSWALQSQISTEINCNNNNNNNFDINLNNEIDNTSQVNSQNIIEVDNDLMRGRINDDFNTSKKSTTRDSKNIILPNDDKDKVEDKEQQNDLSVTVNTNNNNLDTYGNTNDTGITEKEDLTLGRRLNVNFDNNKLTTDQVDEIVTLQDGKIPVEDTHVELIQVPANKTILEEIKENLIKGFDEIFYTQEHENSRIKAFFGFERNINFNSKVDIALYILRFGFLFSTTKNTCKLLTEYLAFAIEETSHILCKHSIQAFKDADKLENKFSKYSAKFGCGLAIGLTGTFWVAFKIARLGIIRPIISPFTSIKEAWQVPYVGPVLAVASGIYTLAAYALIAAFLLPLIIPAATVVAGVVLGTKAASFIGSLLVKTGTLISKIPEITTTVANTARIGASAIGAGFTIVVSAAKKAFDAVLGKPNEIKMIPIDEKNDMSNQIQIGGNAATKASSNPINVPYNPDTQWTQKKDTKASSLKTKQCLYSPQTQTGVNGAQYDEVQKNNNNNSYN